MADIQLLDNELYNGIIGSDLGIWGDKEHERDGRTEDKINELVVATNTINGVTTGLGMKADLVNGKVPLSQMDDSLVGAVEYKEAWDANTNTPTLPSTPTEKGIYYVVSVAGTQFGLTFGIGDWIISNGTIWQKLDATLNAEDIAQILADAVLTGNPTAPTPNLSDSDTSIATTAFVKGVAGNKYTFDTVADMVAYGLTHLFLVTDTIQLLGYYTKNDGAGHYRKIESSDDGSGIEVGGLWANYMYKGNLNILHFGAKKDGITGDSSIIQKAIDLYAYFGTIKFPIGVYAIDLTLNLKQRYIKLIGEGTGFNTGGHNTSATTFKAINGISKIIDCVETSDVQFSPFEIRNIDFDGNEISDIIGLDVKNRHNFRIQDCMFHYCATGLKAEDTWVGIYDNLRFENIVGTGFSLIGSNHSNSFRKITALACGGSCIDIKYNDDYNWSLAFYDTIVESANGYGIKIDIGSSSITFYNNYHENMFNPIFYIKSGNVYCDGGLFIFNGHSDSIGYNDQLVLLDGGTLNFSNGAVIISPYFTYAYSKLAISSTLGVNGKIKFENCILKLPTADTYNKALLGDFLIYKNLHKVYTSYTNGINLTATTYGGLTYTTTDNGTSRIFNITSGGSGKILSLTVPIEKKYKYSTNCSLIIVAKASSNIGASSAVVAGLVDTALYGDIVPIGNFNIARNDNYTTYIFRNINLNAYANYLQFTLSAPVTGGTLEIKEFYLHDSSMVSAGDLFL